MTQYSDKQHGDTLSPTEKPLVLKLADLIEAGPRRSGDASIAAELRRLHEVNEALREALIAALRERLK